MQSKLEDVLDSQIVETVAALALRGRFSTIDLIRKICGRYECDSGISAAMSPNAQFGKRLSVNQASLGIRLSPPDRKQEDDLGQSTTTAVWERA
jgi:hypothetical protein